MFSPFFNLVPHLKRQIFSKHTRTLCAHAYVHISFKLHSKKHLGVVYNIYLSTSDQKSDFTRVSKPTTVYPLLSHCAPYLYAINPIYFIIVFVFYIQSKFYYFIL